MDVGSWLRSLGLERYEAASRENEVDGSVLFSLTAEDLKDLGVTLVGHRRKILDAIAALKADVKSQEAASKFVTAADTRPIEAAERRQVTVLFSDLVGSTALSSQMDPEDLREIISAYQRCVAEVVIRSNGFIAKYLGDGVLVYFGYPQAHEDDAERAVRAGLEVIAAVGALRTGVSLQTRIGIATGTVVVGDLVGSGQAQERGIVGETPNLAARLQGVAGPNMVVIAEGTRRLLGNLFELRDLGPQELKGIAGAVRAWAALGARSAESRFEALHATGVTALVGRDEEADLLHRRWARAKTGKGQVVLLSGEPGIGKSRLTAGLLNQLANEPHTRLRYFCSPQHTNSAFHPLIGQIERAAELARDDTPRHKLDKLDAVLARTSTSKEDAALFAELLSLPNDGRYPMLDLAPAQRRERTLDALTAQMETLTRQSPVLMIFEDAHWIDPTSLEIISRTVNQIQNLRVLLLVTFRPEFQPPWTGRHHVTSLSLNRLAQHDVDSMIDRVIGNGFIPASIRQDIIERSDGIPLFVEEMTKAVLEAETPDEAERTAAAHPSPAVAVPPSLHASLMARLDRLGPSKEVAQIGAAIGREFSHALLVAVVRKPEAELGSLLDRIIAAGLLFRQGIPPHASYLFKHALVQDAAYGTLLREPRRALHASIVEAFESRFPEIAESQPEVLARHCTEAGQFEKAARHWGQAGQRSLERSALVEAVEQLSCALAQISGLPGTPALRRDEIRLQVALITPLLHVKGYAAPETKAAMERAKLLIEQARALGEPLEDPLLLLSVLYAFWVANYVSFNGNAMRELAGQFLKLAEEQRTTGPLMVGHRVMGISLLATGDIVASRTQFTRAIELYDPKEHRSLAVRFSQDNRVAVLSYRSWALWYLGYPEAALRDAKHAVEYAREVRQAATLMYALFHASLPQIHCGHYATADALLDELVALAEEKGSLFWKAFGRLAQGSVLALTGKAADAVKIITSALGEFRSTGSTLLVPTHLSYLARAYGELDQFDDAWRCIDEGMAAVEKTRETWGEADLHRIAGKLALMSRQPDAAKAEAYFDRALAIARAQQARSWELLAATSMTQLWLAQGRQKQARQLLAPIYSWFTEGFETLDLKRAKELLDAQ
jgi:class 3 adenylate cyclase/predicted ATPase